MSFARRIAVVLFGLIGSASAIADVQTFSATKDATLIEDATGSLASGAEDNFWAGRTGQANGVDKRRGMIAFNLSTIPAGSTVTAVTLTLYMDKANSTATPRTVFAYKVLADWGEGTSTAPSGGGQGGPATTNSATWIHRFYPGTLWSVAGGQFTAASSASTSTTAINTFYSWSGAGMIADVQGWVNTPANNFGWMVKGDDTVAEGGSRRFVSRTGATSAQRP